MDKTIQQIIGALKSVSSETLHSLGDFPKPDPFEHGIAVGMYRGLNQALEVVEQVLNDEYQDELRR